MSSTWQMENTTQRTEPLHVCAFYQFTVITSESFLCLIFPCVLLQRRVCRSPRSTTPWVSKSRRPECSCPYPSPPRSWRWSGSPRLRTASTSPTRGASTRSTQTNVTLCRTGSTFIGNVTQFLRTHLCCVCSRCRRSLR